MPRSAWQRSSFSGGGGNNCVETRFQDGVVLLRESEAPEVVVQMTPEQFAAFVRGVKAGEYDHLT
ncbi:DUF397 domain-containing protein [Streptomyces koyangensis]|uniref:DUF397 domain-containing protein n=1 Tax=Streptomyces koyangensis TaxID=188770 RepID=UPI003384E54C